MIEFEPIIRMDVPQQSRGCVHSLSFLTTKYYSLLLHPVESTFCLTRLDLAYPRIRTLLDFCFSPRVSNFLLAPTQTNQVHFSLKSIHSPPTHHHSCFVNQTLSLYPRSIPSTINHRQSPPLLRISCPSPRSFNPSSSMISVHFRY